MLEKPAQTPTSRHAFSCFLFIFMSDTTSVAAPSSGRAFPVTSVVTWVLCILTLGPFLIYPVVRALTGALRPDGQFTPSLLLLPVNDPSAREAMLNSFMIGVAATILS